MRGGGGTITGGEKTNKKQGKKSWQREATQVKPKPPPKKSRVLKEPVRRAAVHNRQMARGVSKLTRIHKLSGMQVGQSTGQQIRCEAEHRV